MIAIEDLDFVYTETGIDRDTYRSFPLALQSRIEQTVESRATAEPKLENRDDSIHASAAVAYGANLVADVAAVPPVARHKTPVLSGLLSQTSDGLSADEATFGRPVTVIGAAGGVGTTAVAVTLARISSRRGCNVSLFDGAEESMAPLYLGAGRSVSSSSAGWVYRPLPETRQGMVSVVACGNSAAGGVEQSPWARTRSMANTAGDMVIDSGCHRYVDCLPQTVEGTTCLVVLAPDIRCILQVRNIESKFAGGGEDTLPRYLLNQFDPEIPLHQEVRASLATHLGHRLAPMTIRSAREIPQALSEGLTVVDYAPGSYVARDFAEVTEWLRSSVLLAAHTKQHVAASGSR